MWHLITYFSQVHRDETYCISLVKKNLLSQRRKLSSYSATISLWQTHLAACLVFHLPQRLSPRGFHTVENTLKWGMCYCKHFPPFLKVGVMRTIFSFLPL